MPFLLPLIFAGLLGALFIISVTRDASIRFYPLFVISLSLPAGFSICSLFIFFSYLILPAQGPFLSILGACALSAFLLFKIITSPPATLTPQPRPSHLLNAWSQNSSAMKITFLICCAIWLFAFVKFWVLFQSVALNNIHGCWDSMFFWHVKASFFFRSPEEWKGMFSNALSWTHQDYPLLLPGALAWGWNWTGKELQIWPAVVAYSFLFSYALIIAWYLSAAVHPFCGLIASAFFMTLGDFSFWGVNLIADVPISFFFTASGVLLLEAFRSEKKALFFLAGWLAGCSAWTKNEGLFFMGWTMLVFGLLLLKNTRTAARWKSLACLLALGICIPFSATFVLKYFLAGGGDYLGSNRGLGTLLQSIFMDWPKTRIILMAFPAYMFKTSAWTGLWILFLCAWACLAAIPALRKSDVWAAGALACLVLLGYAVVLHISPHPIVWQIQTALSRLIVHAGGLALIFTFGIFGQMTGLKLPGSKPAD